MDTGTGYVRRCDVDGYETTWWGWPVTDLEPPVGRLCMDHAGLCVTPGGAAPAPGRPVLSRGDAGTGVGTGARVTAYLDQARHRRQHVGITDNGDSCPDSTAGLPTGLPIVGSRLSCRVRRSVCQRGCQPPKRRSPPLAAAVSTVGQAPRQPLPLTMGGLPRPEAPRVHELIQGNAAGKAMGNVS
jgi:hypothetical protein